MEIKVTAVSYALLVFSTMGIRHHANHVHMELLTLRIILNLVSYVPGAASIIKLDLKMKTHA